MMCFQCGLLHRPDGYVVEEADPGPEEEEEEEEAGLEEGETGSPAQGQWTMEPVGVEMQAQHFVAGFGQPAGPGLNEHNAGHSVGALPPPQARRNITFCCFWSRKFRCRFPHCRFLHDQPLTPVQQVAVATGTARLVCERQVKYGFCKHAGIDHI